MGKKGSEHEDESRSADTMLPFLRSKAGGGGAKAAGSMKQHLPLSGQLFLETLEPLYDTFLS